MSRVQIKEWARAKLKENFWPVCGAVVVASIITGFSIYTGKTVDANGNTTYNSITIGWIFYFVTVGLAYYMVKLINNKNPEFRDIFHFSGDFGRCLGACLLQALWIFLWSLLFIIPGIIKALGYAMVPYLLADEKYKDMKVSDILKKSQEMMDGHKGDYFVFGLSFIAWWLLVIITCGIASLYVAPYQQLATAKFLNDIKLKAEGVSPDANMEGTPKEEVKYCPQCGAENKINAKTCKECKAKF